MFHGVKGTVFAVTAIGPLAATSLRRAVISRRDGFDGGGVRIPAFEGTRHAILGVLIGNSRRRRWLCRQSEMEFAEGGGMVRPQPRR